MQVADKTVVALRYCMKNSKGDVLEDILNARPVEYLHGSGNILPELEKSLVGLTPGDERSLSISGQTGLQVESAFYFDVVIDNVREATEEEIKKGKPVLPNSKEECGPGCCC